MATLQEMRKQAIFEQWDDFFSEDMAEDSRAVYHETIQRLIDLGPERTREQCMEILGQYVEAFNALDENTGMLSKPPDARRFAILLWNWLPPAASRT